MIFLFCAILSVFSVSQVKDIPFHDPHVTKRWTLSGETIADWDHLPVSTDSSSIFLFNSQKNIIFHGGNSLWVAEYPSQTQSWKRIEQLNITNGMRLFMLNEQAGKFIIAGGIGIYEFQCSETKCKMDSFVSHTIGTVNDIIHNEHLGGNAVWIASKNGLFLYRDEMVSRVPQFNEKVNALATMKISHSDNDYMVAIGSDRALYLFVNEEMEVSKWKHYWVLSMIDNNVTALEFDYDGVLYIGNRDSINLYDTKTELFSRLGGLQGLPYGNVTLITKSEKRIFVGSKKGISWFDREEQIWHYFYGDRWVHGSVIKSLQVLKDNGIISLTESGASIIMWKHWTLQEKAFFFEDMVEPRHNRFWLVSDCALQSYADLRTFKKIDSDNDGSWTSDFAISQVFKYATTKSEEAKKNAWNAFSALELLNDVSGIKGFTARSVLPIEEKEHHSGGFNSTVMPSLQFKGDTSSDEIIAHMLTYTVMYDYLVETEEERKRVVRLVDNIVSYIIDNDYWLLDYNRGVPTRWGCWNPQKLNGDPFWKEERGLNSLHMISFVLNAYRMTGKEMYMDSYRTLVNDFEYDKNILNQKLEIAFNVDHSDDRLANLGYLCLYFALDKMKSSELDPLRESLKKSIERTYEIIKEEKSTPFDAAYALICQPKDFELNVWSLQTWSQSLIDFPMDNSHRIDIVINPEPLVRNLLQPSEWMKVIPYNERNFLRWNGNPWGLNGGGGHTEMDPTSWLFTYWSARFFSLITPPMSSKSRINVN